jgi:SWI/SNF-related matrix-associated actin-dependent regulator 1 of chromatin subfamily A
VLKNCLYTEKGSGRGRRRLDDSLDEEKHSVLPLATRSIPVLSSESSLSESETVGEEEGEGLKRDSKEDKLSCLNDRSTRSLGKTKGETPDLEELEGDLSDFSEEEEDFSELKKAAILSLLDGISLEEAQAVPGLSENKAALLLAQRPFHNWEHLTEAVVSVKGLSEKCLEGCGRLLKEREMMADLLSQCQAISSSIQNLVDQVRLKKEEQTQQQQQSQEDSASDDIDFPLPSMIAPGLVLKPYQKVGVSWLSLLHSQNLNAILADEMGLGKTIQTIVFLSHLYEQGLKGPHLIVVPSSTLDNWVRELNCWSPSLNVITYWGSLGERSDMRRDMLSGDHQGYYDVILTTYTTCIGRVEDRKFLRKLKLKTLVLDEGHMVKNMSTLKYNHLMKIEAERRLLLTGTPLQNNLLELMSLLSFVMPSVFRPYLQPLQSAFRHSRHTAEGSGYYQEQVSRAKEIMCPFILRRLKKEVLHQLPRKVESVEHCALTPEQSELYHKEVELGRKETKNGRGKELVRSMSVLTQLRKAANHPLLLRSHYSDDIIASMSTEILKEREYRDADATLVAEDMAVMSDFELHNLCVRHESLVQYRLSDDLIKESGKFKYLEKKLGDCKEQGRRVLIFSQFIMILDILEAWLQLLGHSYLRLDGKTHMNDRQMLIDQYNSSDDILVFLLSTKAGGLGINLTSASMVVLHDIDFNPYNDKQAEDRCHRVGQTREVEVVRLVGRDTVEEEILRCAQQKLKLEQDMTAGSQLSKTDMASLLSQGLKL